MKLVVDASVPSRVATATSRVKAIVQHTRQQRLTGDMVHLEVATRHELNVHLLPSASGVCGPGEGALAADLEDVARARGSGHRVCAHEGRTGDENGKTSVCKHRMMCFRVLKRDGVL